MIQKITTLVVIGILTANMSKANLKTEMPVISISVAEATKAKKLVIRGNVDVTLVQDGERTKLFTQQDGEKVRIKEDDATITVSNKNKERVSITLFIDNVYRIDAGEGVNINSKNTLRVAHLQLILKENAVANISVRANSVYTMLANEAQLTLEGYTDAHSISMNELAKLNTAKLQTERTETELRLPADYTASR